MDGHLDLDENSPTVPVVVGVQSASPTINAWAAPVSARTEVPGLNACDSPTRMQAEVAWINAWAAPRVRREVAGMRVAVYGTQWQRGRRVPETTTRVIVLDDLDALLCAQGFVVVTCDHRISRIVYHKSAVPTVTAVAMAHAVEDAIEEDES